MERGSGHLPPCTHAATPPCQLEIAGPPGTRARRCCANDAPARRGSRQPALARNDLCDLPGHTQASPQCRPAQRTCVEQLALASTPLHPRTFCCRLSAAARSLSGGPWQHGWGCGWTATVPPARLLCTKECECAGGGLPIGRPHSHPHGSHTEHRWKARSPPPPPKPGHLKQLHAAGGYRSTCVCMLVLMGEGGAQGSECSLSACRGDAAGWASTAEEVACHSVWQGLSHRPRGHAPSASINTQGYMTWGRGGRGGEGAHPHPTHPIDQDHGGTTSNTCRARTMQLSLHSSLPSAA